MIKKTFIINGKEYEAKEFDFDLLADLEELGVSLDDIGERPMSSIRAYFALCAGLKKKAASEEIQEHVIAGGTLDELSEAFTEKINNSDFFQALSKGPETEAPAGEGEEAKAAGKTRAARK